MKNMKTCFQLCSKRRKVNGLVLQVKKTFFENLLLIDVFHCSRVGSTVGSIGSGNNLQVSDSNSNLKTASIVIRPLSRKDIFYSRSIYNIDDTSEVNEKVSECKA